MVGKPTIGIAEQWSGKDKVLQAETKRSLTIQSNNITWSEWEASIVTTHNFLMIAFGSICRKRD